MPDWWKRFWCSLHGHGEFAVIGMVSVLAHVRCVKCGAEYCYNVWGGTFLPWTPKMEAVFAECLAHEKAANG